MSFKVKRVSPAQVIAGERLYLDAKRENIVREGDPSASFLLAAAGQTVPAQWVAKLGLDESAPVVGTEPERRSTRPLRASSTR